MRMLKAFKTFAADKCALRKTYGADLHNVEVEPEIVSAADVIFAIESYLNRTVTKEQLVQWVNVLWFTDLYEYESACEDTIAEVMTLLESIDEEEVAFSEEEYREMIEALRRNRPVKL